MLRSTNMAVKVTLLTRADMTLEAESSTSDIVGSTATSIHSESLSAKASMPRLKIELTTVSDCAASWDEQ